MRAIFKAFSYGFFVSLSSVLLLFIATTMFADTQNVDHPQQTIHIE